MNMSINWQKNYNFTMKGSLIKKLFVYCIMITQRILLINSMIKKTM